MSLTSLESLEVVSIILALIFLFLSIMNIVYHRDTAWIFIAIFCLFKTVGSAMTLNLNLHPSKSVGLIVAAKIFSSIALSPLLAAAIAFTTTATRAPTEPPRIMRALLLVAHILVTIAPALGTIGGVKSAPKNGVPPDPKKYETFTHASALVFLATWIVLSVAVALLLALNTGLRGGARRLVTALAVSLPFLLVRVAFSIITAFRVKAATKVGTQAVMGLLMEVTVVSVLTATGVGIHRFGRGGGSNRAGNRIPRRGEEEILMEGGTKNIRPG